MGNKHYRITCVIVVVVVVVVVGLSDSIIHSDSTYGPLHLPTYSCFLVR